jgi:hypothetical protein
MSEGVLSYVVCLDNSNYPASLEVRKIYRRIGDSRAEADGLIRVIDESGEDYLFPARMFAPIEVPEAVEKTFAGAG